MIAPPHSASEWRPRLKSAGAPINGDCFTDGRGLIDLLAGFGRVGEILRLRAHTQANVRTWLLEFCRAAGRLS